MSHTKILVIEDDIYFADLIQNAMEEQGLDYDFFVRAHKSEHGISLMDIDGKVRTLDHLNYWTALVDSRLKGSTLQGVDLASRLSKLGLPVIAISGMDTLNQIMIDAGALIGIRKDNLWVDLFKGKLDLRKMVADQAAKIKAKGSDPDKS